MLLCKPCMRSQLVYLPQGLLCSNIALHQRQLYSSSVVSSGAGHQFTALCVVHTAIYFSGTELDVPHSPIDPCLTCVDAGPLKQATAR